MKKFLKIIGFSFLGLIALIVIAGALVPTLFKDDIKKGIDEAIAENVNADVYFNPDKFGLSVFSNFPNVTVTLDEFGVVGIDKFEGDTLMAVNSFKVVVDLMSIINGDKMKINGIYLVDPYIQAIVTEDGLANYDITKPTEEEIEEEETAPFNMAIDVLSIKNAHIIYDDQLGDMYAEMKGLNYEAAIELSEIYQLASTGNIEEINYIMEGITYMNKGKLDLKFDTEMDLENMKFKFKENLFTLNDFAFGFDGTVEMPDTLTTNLDITYQAKETSFKNILSLVPGVFLEDFDALKTSGELKFDGFAKGSLVGEQIPAFELNLYVNDGMFQYPDLPTAVKNVNVDLKVNNEDGVVDNTIVNLQKFHMDMGKNPVDAKLLLKGLTDMVIDADVKAKVNLGEINKIYPIEGLSMKGVYALDAIAKGTYSEESGEMPEVNAKMKLSDGYVKSEEFPVPMENMQLDAEVFSDGDMANSWFKLHDFNMLMDGERFHAAAAVENFDDIVYDASFDGVINITKMMKVYPMEDMELGGVIAVNHFETSGTMADIDSENYLALETSGAATVEGFSFVSPDLPEGFKLDHAVASFNPSYMQVDAFDGFVGKSDIHLTGKVDNYMGYLFSETDTILTGTMDFRSNKFDLNEWMTEEEVPVEEEIPLEVVPIPNNVDFVLNATIDQLLYDTYDIKDMNGEIIIRDGIATMKDAGFKMIGASFAGGGYYDTRDINHPKYSMDFNIENMKVSEAYKTFNTIQSMAPIAKTLTGSINTDLHIDGELGQDMMPVLKTLNGGGFLTFLDGNMGKVGATQSIADVTGFNGLSGASLKDVLINFKLDEGTLLTENFPFTANGVSMLIGGKSFLDGTMDYGLNMNLPTDKVGNTLTSSLSSSGLGNLPFTNGIDLMLGLNGPTDDPKVKIKKAKPSGPGLKETASANLKAEADKRKAETKARLEAEKAKREAEAKAKIAAEKKKAQDAAKKKLEEEAKKKAGNKATDAIKKIKKPW